MVIAAAAAVLMTSAAVMRGFHRYVSVPPFPHRHCPLQKDVRITFIRKNSVRTP